MSYHSLNGEYNLKIPSDPYEVTPEWITKSLRDTEITGQARIETVNFESIADNQGITGQLVRIRLNYNLAEESGPRSLIAKFPTTNPQVREFIFTVTRHYQREAHFYQQVADAVPVKVPKLYYSAVDVASRKSILLIEDLAQFHTLDKRKGCPPQEAAHAIREIARLHAAWWEGAALADLTEIAFDHPEFAKQMQHLYQGTWPAFLAKMGSRLPDAFVEIGHKLGECLTYVHTQLLQSPQTLLHRDFQLDNLLFASTDINSPPTFIDWQLMSVGRGTQEIAYFIGTSMSLTDRRRTEDDLLRLYYSTLTDLGVKEYTFEQCLVDYRLALCKAFADAVVAFTKVELSEQQEQTVYEIIMPRHVAAILDHNAGLLLPV